MKKIVLASANKHKIKEFNELLEGFEVISLDDIGFVDDIDETGETCEENAQIKTNSVRKFLIEHGENLPVIADDTGLFIDALGGAPGVHTARFCGDHNDEGNRNKVLNLLKNKSDRSAHFKCVICYQDDKQTKLFVGKTFGKITTERRGSEAFGYDCLFESDDLGKTFGEATEEEKNWVSHRGRAVDALKEFLKTLK